MSGKTKVLAVARKLFWKKGYKSTSMNDIAEAYGCKPGNIYNFFDSKEAILFEVLLEEMDQIIDPIKHLEQDEDSSPLEQLRLIISSHVQLTLSYRRTSKSLFDVALDNLSPSKRKQIVALRDTYERILRKVITRGIRAKCFPDIDPRLAGIMIASMIVRTRVWFHPKKGLSPDQIADFIFRFALHGLGGREPSG
ncbi:MAG: TetR/AcrR family transcriptional regulator [Thermodesulfobacteriota bacterium]